MRFLVDYGLQNFKLAQMRWSATVQQNQGTSRNVYGETVDNWVNVATLFAFFKPLTGREYYNAKMVGANADYLMICRYYNFTPDMRITTNCLGGAGAQRYFNIYVSLNPGEMGNCTLTMVFMKEHRPSMAES